jgi:hypothetical protein
MIDDFLIIGPLFKFLFAFAAVIGLVYVSRRLDVRSGFTFAETAKIIRRSSLATGIYYGLRLVALAILVGMVMG